MPDVSVIIPTFNRAPQLAKVMASIADAIDSKHDIEVLVIDNGSIDATATTFTEVAERFPRHEWRYIYEPMPGLLSGRHRGAIEARGEILSYLDDDVTLSATWLDGLIDAFSDPEVTLVGGPSLPQYEIAPPDWLEPLWHQDAEGRRSLFELSLIDAGAEVRSEDPLYVLGLNFSIRKAAFERCGGFHPDCIPAALQRYQGDGETGLTLKAKAIGLRALYHPMVALKHVIPASRMTLQAFVRRGFYQGVCDSYTLIRARNGPNPARWRSWRDAVHSAIFELERKLVRRNPTTSDIRGLMARAHRAGMEYHQREVRNDPKLLEWVLKPNYLDYTLPDGWKTRFK